MKELERFINFGVFLDKKNREKLVSAILDFLIGKTDNINLNNNETENFGESITNILNSNTKIKEICKDNPELSEQITNDIIIKFIEATKKKINKIPSPYEEEYDILNKFKLSDKQDFDKIWKLVKPVIIRNYKKYEIDVEFYEQEFCKSIDEKYDDNNKKSFVSIKEHIIEKWEKLLIEKQNKWELEQIDNERKNFIKELNDKIEKLKKLQEIFDPFKKELGRLWDMSKGNWHKVNYDILKRYSELLEKEESIKKLAEMLGRMRLSEKDYEEEVFAQKQLKSEWIAEHAGKSDLIGVHESDDLSNLLPSEIALLSDKFTQSIFFKKFVEKKLQTFEYQSRTLSFKEEELVDKRQKEKEDPKGPFIICIDTSGSMHGTPEIIAKTICFAILKIAIRDNRKCYLISYSYTFRTLELHNLQKSLPDLVNFLSMSFHGGNNEPLAMKEVLRILKQENYKKSDVLWVSDFVSIPFNKEIIDEINLAKENKTLFHSLTIGHSGNKQLIEQFDNNWIYDPGNPNGIIDLVKNINMI